MGPSGCGKSTLLHLLGGWTGPSAGRFGWPEPGGPDERAALARLRPGLRRFVFQAFHLMDELTAVENVELPALLAAARRGRPAAGDRLIERVGLPNGRVPAPRTVRGASGSGSRSPARCQRAAVILADEPTGNLDSAATLEVLPLFESLHAAGQTLVVVTHDSRIAATADRMISMRTGPSSTRPVLTGGTSGDIVRAGRRLEGAS
jgi:putative ABC transport system ATP-binding protein